VRYLKLKLTLTQYILLGLVLGLLIGLLSPEVGASLSILSTIFIRLLQMMVVPLVFSTLVVGVAGAKGGGSFKRLALRTVVFFLVATTVAALFGIAFTNIMQPGVRGERAIGIESEVPVSTQEPPSLVETLIPTSIFQAFHGNNLTALVLFTVAFGLALRSVAPRGDLILKGCEALAAIMFRLTEYVMWVAPLGVLGAMAATVARTGFEGLGPFLALLLTSYLAEIAFVLVFFTVVAVVFRFSLIPFLKKMGDALLLAYTTASGAAALPAAMERLEEWGASRRTVSFVLPLGYSFNLTGIALYLPMVTIFWAQFNGVPLSWNDQAMLLLYVLIVIRGLPPVPRGFFLIWASLLARFDLPPEGLVILLAVDPLIDMARTIVNVGGNCLAVAALDRWEKLSGDEDA
jgi:proton glutamate symport protein